jgi:phosphatidate cytidylyltransferase
MPGAIAGLEDCEMGVRIFSGTIASILLICAILAPPFVIMAVILAATLLAVLEFRQAVQSVKHTVDPFTVVLMTVMLIFNSRFGDPAVIASLTDDIALWPASVSGFSHKLLEAAAFAFSAGSVRVMAFLCIVWLFGRLIFQNDRFHLDDLAMTVMCVLYIPFLMSFIMPVRSLPYGGILIWCVMIGAIVTDTMAYFVGVTFGKRKLLPLISPKKTVEGAIGGVVGCTVIMTALGLLAAPYIHADMPWQHFLLLGLLCGVVSQVGDWSASAIKRSAGIKDFGKLIPGHGGMLDRIDSILFVGPVVYLYLRTVLGM